MNISSYKDVLMCLMIMVGYFWLRRYEKKEETEFNRKTVQLSDYAIEISNIPANCSIGDIYHHINQSSYGLNYYYPITSIDFMYEEDSNDIEYCRKINECLQRQHKLLNEHRSKRLLLYYL